MSAPRDERPRALIDSALEQLKYTKTFGEPWDEAPRASRFVVVGFGLDREALERAFAECDAATTGRS